MSKIILMTLMGACLMAGSVDAEETGAEGSIGVTAGRAVADLKGKTEAAKLEMQAVAAQMQTALDQFNQEAKKVMEDMNAAISVMRQKMELEIQRFQETVKAAEAEKAAAGPPAPATVP